APAERQGGARKRRAEALRRGPRARDAHGPRGAARREPSRLARAGEGGPGAGAPGRRRLRRARARPGARRARPRAPAGDRPASALLGCHRAGDRRGSREEGSRAFVSRNGTARPQRGLVLLEDLADPRPAVDEFLHAREPGEERRNWFDRTVGYPRWAWLVARKRGAAIAPRPLPALRPGDAGEVVIELLPLRRGRLAFTAVTI